MPDHGLSSVFKPVKFLGRGGTGDTWLYETLAPTAGVPHLLLPLCGSSLLASAQGVAAVLGLACSCLCSGAC